MVDGEQQQLLFNDLHYPVKQDKPEAIKLREQGMRAALDHAEDVNAGWKEAAYMFVLTFPATEFKNEDVRVYAYNNGLPHPPDERSWGGVIRRAMHAGIIEKIGMTTAEAPGVHAHPITKWRKTGKTELINTCLKEVVENVSTSN